jgi:hypothetical protein
MERASNDPRSEAMILRDVERHLLEKLAAEGKSTRLFAEDVPVAKALEAVGLLFLIGQDEPYAVITPKGRTLLAKPRVPPALKPPSSLLE